MTGRVSQSKIETQGRAERMVSGEQNHAQERKDSPTFAEAYQAILARELLIINNQEDYCKSF